MSKRNKGVVLCAFSKPESTPPNRRIVEIGVKYATEHGTPIFAQRDTSVPEDLGLDVEYTDGWIDYYVDPTTTLRMARDVTKWAKARNISQLIIVGTKPHMWRCIRDQIMANKEGGVNIEVIPHEEIANTKYNSWFYLESTQWWCRSVWHWLPRETILWLMPFWLYKRIAN